MNTKYERTVKERERIHIRGRRIEQNYIYLFQKEEEEEAKKLFKFRSSIKTTKKRKAAAGLRPVLPLKAKTDYRPSD